MILDLQTTKLQDDILSAIISNSNQSLFSVGMAYKKLRSFDKLLSCITKATQKKRPLESVVDVMMEGNNGN